MRILLVPHVEIAMKKRKRGPKVPDGGRVRFTVNLPADLLPFVKSLDGRSQSGKVVFALQRLQRFLDDRPRKEQ